MARSRADCACKSPWRNRSALMGSPGFQAPVTHVGFRAKHGTFQIVVASIEGKVTGSMRRKTSLLELEIPQSAQFGYRIPDTWDAGWHLLQ